MAAGNSNNTSSFMEEIQRYDCLYNKFSKDYKNRRTRENAWEAIGQKFGLSAEEAEKKYKNIRTSYTRHLKKVKSVPSGSGRDAVPKTGEFANLQWLDQHISHRKSASNWSNHESDEEEASQLQEDDNMNSSMRYCKPMPKSGEEAWSHDFGAGPTSFPGSFVFPQFRVPVPL